MPIVTGDNHLAPYTWSRHPSLRGDGYFALKQIVDICLREKESLVILGDLFDAKKLDSRTVIEFHTQMDRLQKGGVPVYAIQGQHDLSDPPWVESHQNIIHVNKKMCLFDENTYFLDYRDPETLAEDLKHIPKEAGALCLHQAFKQALPFEDDIGNTAWDFEASQIPEHVKLILMGDIHHDYTFNIGGHSFYYVGTTNLQAIDEPPDKSVILWKDNKITRIPLATRPFYRGTVVSKETLKATCETIRTSIPDPRDSDPSFPEEVAKPYVVVIFQSDIEDAQEDLNSACNDRGCERWLVPIRPELVSNGKIIDNVAPNKVSAETCLDQLVDKTSENELHGFLVRLLRTNNVEEVRNVLAVQRDAMGVALE